jgi:uncharacterized protein YyaL (SSP411 family)
VYQDGTAKVDGFLEDWGGLAAGLVALYQATFAPRWLDSAVRLADGAQERFWDLEQKAYRTAPRGQADLVVETYALHDNAVPSGASLLTEANAVLAALTGRRDSSTGRGRTSRGCGTRRWRTRSPTGTSGARRTSSRTARRTWRWLGGASAATRLRVHCVAALSRRTYAPTSRSAASDARRVGRAARCSSGRIADGR